MGLGKGVLDVIYWRVVKDCCFSVIVQFSDTCDYIIYDSFPERCSTSQILLFPDNENREQIIQQS